MNDCQHFTNGICKVASDAAGQACATNEKVCTACTTLSLFPRQLNRHNLSLVNRVNPAAAIANLDLIRRDHATVNSLFVYYPEGWRNLTYPECECSVKTVPLYPLHAFAGVCDCKTRKHVACSTEANLIAKPAKIQCLKIIGDSCSIAETIAGKPVAPTDLHCTACANSTNPKTYNPATVSLALSAVPEAEHAETCDHWRKALERMISITAFLPCKFRGEVVDRFACPCKGKRNGVPLYACQVHQFCAMDTADKERIIESMAQAGNKFSESPYAGARACEGCPNRVE